MDVVLAILIELQLVFQLENMHRLEPIFLWQGSVLDLISEEARHMQVCSATKNRPILMIPI